MKKEIYYTLLSDGSSDRMLIPIINWTFRQNLEETILIQSNWANLYHSHENDLVGKINYAIDKFPCDILFVHRDTEKKGENVFHDRMNEIETAWAKAIKHKEIFVPIIPVRMTEAWLLIDELAIRKASGNSNGTTPINLPQIQNLETLSEPKKILEELLYTASELKGRNRKKFNVAQAKHLVSNNIIDFSQLRQLQAFQFFETFLKKVLES